jgi:polysaccharide biosynthesis/export protein
MKNINCLILAMTLFASVAYAQSRATNAVVTNRQPAARTAAQDPAVTPEGYVIGPEDALTIAVWREPELSTRAVVRPDGKIGVPLLGDVQASGLTPNRLQEHITEGLKKYINEPQVSILVDQIRSQMVYVTGAVIKPGVYPLGGPMTVFELLVRAGGLAEFAKGENIQILRKQDEKQVQLRFNFKRFSEGSLKGRTTNRTSF